MHQTISVPVHGDTVDEVIERFFFDVSNVQNASAPVNRASGIIFDDDGPSISVNDININEGNSGTSSATFTLTLSSVSVDNVRVRVTTQAGTATSQNDYLHRSIDITIPAGTLSGTFSVPVIGDTVVEPDETFFVNLNLPVAGTIADGQGVGTIVNDDATLQFSGAQIGVVENDNRPNLTVTRVGVTLPAVTVDYTTSDTAGLNNCNVANGIASSRCDYMSSTGTLRFASGETSKSISILIVDSSCSE